MGAANHLGYDPYDICQTFDLDVQSLDQKYEEFVVKVSSKLIYLVAGLIKKPNLDHEYFFQESFKCYPIQ